MYVRNRIKNSRRLVRRGRLAENFYADGDGEIRRRFISDRVLNGPFSRPLRSSKIMYRVFRKRTEIAVIFRIILGLTYLLRCN